MQNSIRIDRNVAVEMRDGAVLGADVFRLNDRRKHPVILIMTPYGRMWTHNSTTGNINVYEAVIAGYTVVIQDERVTSPVPTGKQEDPAVVLGRDGYDSVEWLAGQRWCDGNIGMIGASALGFVQWMTAMETPPHLKAIAPWMCEINPRVRPSQTGGNRLYAPVSQLPRFGHAILDRMEKLGRNVTEMRRVLKWAESNPEENLQFLAR